MGECVIEYDVVAVAAARKTVLTSRRVSAIVSIVGGGFGLAVTLGLLWLTGGQEWWVVALIGLTAGLMLSDGARRLARTRALVADWAALGLPPVALHLTPDGLRFWSDSAHTSVFLPWPAVTGFHLEGKPAGRLYVFDLVPGAPGIDPRNGRLTLGVRWLRVPPPEVDRLFAQFTGGRVRVHTGSPGYR